MENYELLYYPLKCDDPNILEGDRVFVDIKHGKEYSHGVIINQKVEIEKWKGRWQVAYDLGGTAHVRPKRVTKEYRMKPSIIITRNTTQYR